MHVKLSLVTKGCNGQSYKIAYTNEKGKFDEVVAEDNVNIILDAKSLLFLIGTEIDYVEDDIRSEFVFRNPKAKSQCGCGESFNF